MPRPQTQVETLTPGQLARRWGVSVARIKRLLDFCQVQFADFGNPKRAAKNLQCPEQTVPDRDIGGRLLPGLDIGHVLVGQNRKRLVEPLATARQFSLPAGSAFSFRPAT